MKATELRIGNWYDCHEGDEMNNTAIVQLRDIIWTNDGIGYELKHLNDRAVGVTLYPEKLKPIPLTEEWLKRFGFEIKKGAWGTSAEIRIGRVRYVLYQNGNVWSINPTDGFKVDFKYIHTVQNHYFALTGQELNQNKEDE